MIGRRLLVSGRVQGVFYRSWTVATARALGVTGWVRNLRSGEVEIHAVGPEAAVAALAERCRQGPPAAEVEEVEVFQAAAEPFDRFDTRPTA